jgi:hypothetical protein
LKQVAFAQLPGDYGMIALTAHDNPAFSVNSSRFPYREEVPRPPAVGRQVGAWFHLLADCKFWPRDEFLLQNCSFELE